MRRFHSNGIWSAFMLKCFHNLQSLPPTSNGIAKGSPYTIPGDDNDYDVGTQRVRTREKRDRYEINWLFHHIRYLFIFRIHLLPKVLGAMLMLARTFFALGHGFKILFCVLGLEYWMLKYVLLYGSLLMLLLFLFFFLRFRYLPELNRSLFLEFDLWKVRLRCL